MGKIKIYKAFQTYQNYVDDFYLRNTHLNTALFTAQREALIYDSFPWIFTWSPNNIDPDVEIFETVHNCEPLQRAWNKEKKYNSNWQTQIVLDQIKEQQPHIIVLYPPETFTHELIEEIKSIVNHETIIVGYDGINRKDKELYKSFDIIISCSNYIAYYYKENGFNTYTLTFCFDSKILNKIKKRQSPLYSVGFSGSLYNNLHDSRYELIKYLSRKTKIDIRSEYGMNINYSLTAKNQLKRLIKQKDVSNYLALWRISKMNKGPVFGLNMYQFLSDSKISINKHIDTVTFAANVRMYEATGVGSLLLTDWKENMAELFEPDKESVTYSSKEEAYDKIKFLLKNEAVRNKIALAGQKRTLTEYTYSKTIPDLISFLKNSLK